MDIILNGSPVSNTVVPQVTPIQEQFEKQAELNGSPITLDQLKPIKFDIEKPITIGPESIRGLDTTRPYNKPIPEKLIVISDSDWTPDHNIFDKDPLKNVETSIQLLQEILTEVSIRFDTDPDFYTKDDYYKLIWYLCNVVIYSKSLEDKIGLSGLPPEYMSVVQWVYDNIESIYGLLQDGDSDSIAGLNEAIRERFKELTKLIQEESLRAKQEETKLEAEIHNLENRVDYIAEHIELFWSEF